MSYDTGIANRLRAKGIPVIEVDGWTTRGSSSFGPGGSVNHHTAGSANGATPSLNLCIHGRPDLAGPLCNVFQSREPGEGNDIAYVVAAGRANHAGEGGWNGLSGNSSVYGLEIEHTGVVELPRHRQETAAAIHAAMFLGDPGMLCQHFEWTSRKIDAATGVDPHQFRQRMGYYQTHQYGPGGSPPKPPEDDDMIPVIGVQNDPNRYYAALCDGYVRIFYGWDPGGLDSRTVWCHNDELDKGTGVLYKPLTWVAADVYDQCVATAKKSPGWLISVFGVVGDATAYYMAPRDGYVQIFHQWDPGIDDPLVVWSPSEVYQACVGETYATVTYVDRATYDAIAVLAKTRPDTVPAGRGEDPGDR